MPKPPRTVDGCSLPPIQAPSKVADLQDKKSYEDVLQRASNGLYIQKRSVSNVCHKSHNTITPQAGRVANRFLNIPNKDCLDPSEDIEEEEGLNQESNMLAKHPSPGKRFAQSAPAHRRKILSINVPPTPSAGGLETSTTMDSSYTPYGPLTTSKSISTATSHASTSLQCNVTPSSANRLQAIGRTGSILMVPSPYLAPTQSMSRTSSICMERPFSIADLQSTRTSSVASTAQSPYMPCKTPSKARRNSQLMRVRSVDMDPTSLKIHQMMKHLVDAIETQDVQCDGMYSLVCQQRLAQPKDKDTHPWEVAAIMLNNPAPPNHWKGTGEKSKTKTAMFEGHRALSAGNHRGLALRRKANQVHYTAAVAVSLGMLESKSNAPANGRRGGAYNDVTSSKKGVNSSKKAGNKILFSRCADGAVRDLIQMQKGGGLGKMIKLD